MIHLSPSILNSWYELHNANDESPPWVNPKEFKDTVMGVFKKSMNASAGNACSISLFENDHAHSEDGYNFVVSEKLLDLRHHFPYGTGIPEVSRVRELEGELFDGEKVRLSFRTDYLCPNVIVELKTSSKPFDKKGKTRSYLESMQSFSYMDCYQVPIIFLFAEIKIRDESEGYNFIEVKKTGHATAYPCKESGDRLRAYIRSLVPYLKSDPQMWERVTNRTPIDEF